MALPNSHLTPKLGKSANPDKDPDDAAYPLRRSQQGDDSRPGGSPTGVMTLKQRLAARKEQETGVRQPAAHAHPENQEEYEPSSAKVNLIGSMMNEHAVYSLVTQTDNITYLDLRGNGLDSAFGWKLIKAMKKQYLRLDFCNGINTKRIRENTIEDLNMTGFLSHNGLFGIEPVGAIFLAHFLRTNTSLTKIQFQRNNVGKDGAKAIAQAIITNTGSLINEVNHMRPHKKRGVHFSKFQSKEIETIRMANYNLVDEDIVFLEEYLSRHDCVKELDLKGNPFYGEGVRKLGRFLGVSQNLEILRLDNVPVSLEGIQLLTKGITANQSLTWIAFPLGITYGASKELLQIMHQLGVALSRHPKMERWGATPVRLDYVKKDTMGEYNTMRLLNTGLHADVSLFFWVMATCKPTSRSSIEWNPSKAEGHEYPAVKPYSPALLLAISSACHQMRAHLTEVTIAVAKDMTGVAQFLYYMAGSDALKTVNLLAYANAKISFEELPKEWHDEGQLPLWFRECMKEADQRRLWDALWGFVQRTKNLEQFNNVNLKEFTGDSTELQVMLMCECQHDFKAVKESDDEITLYFGNTCKPEFPFQATRLLNPKKRYHINLEFIGKNQQAIKDQQDAIALLIVAKGDGANGSPTFPTYVHKVRVRNNSTSKQLINTMEYSPCLEEIYIESIENVLAVLVKSLCVGKSREALKRIKVNRYWYPSRKMPPNFSEKQRDRLKLLHDWVRQSSRFDHVSSTIMGTVDKAELATMTLQDFGVLMSGVRVEPSQVQTVYAPSVNFEVFHDTYNYFYPPEEGEADDENAGKPIYMLFPLHEDFPGRSLKTINLTNANIKEEVKSMYPDQYAESSKKLWLDKQCYRQLANHEPREIEGDGMDPDYGDYIRFHWNSNVSIGSGHAAEVLSKVHLIDDKKISKGFHFDVLYKILESIMKAPNLSDLDLRGNGLDLDDAQVVIKLLSESTLDTLNGIPVQMVVQDDIRELNFSGGPIELPSSPDDRPEIDEYAVPEAVATISACRAWRGVRLDEGDAAIFEHVVTTKRFPNLEKICFQKHIIKEDSMQILCNTLALHKKIKEVSFSECVMDNGASAHLAHTLGSMGDLIVVNNVGIGAKGRAGSGPPIWNDANLALIGRKNCWNELAMNNERDASLNLERSISDAGLRGLCSYIRYAAGNKHAITGMPNLKKVDLSYNRTISDAVIAEFCRSLMMPGAAPDLEEIDLRYCSQLKARSAFELHHLVQRDTENTQGSCRKLSTINGLNVKLLILSAQQGKATAPLIVRMHGGALEDLHSEWKAPKLLSEADTHFFAHCLHMFPNIPHCHLHMIMASGAMEQKPKNFRIPGYKTTRNTSSPFLKPTKTESYYDKQFEACESFFQACPVSTRLQLSVTPKPDIYYAKEERGIDIPGDDLVLLPPVSGSKNAAKSDSIFGATVRSILKVKERRRKMQEEEGTPEDSRPTKPMYVNNINSQRLHNQYRSLYGYDDVDIMEKDIHDNNNTKNRIIVPSDVDLSNLFSVVSSLDLQYLGLTKHHVESFAKSISTKDLDLGMLTHLNLNNNNLYDNGVATLMDAFVTAGTTIVHLSLSHNGICDDGAIAIAQNLYAMQRLTSLSINKNSIRESGAAALATAIGGRKDGDHIPLLSIDLSKNFGRELGAERWAKTLQKHPTLQFFNYAENEMAYVQNTYFLALVFASVQSPALAVLDLSNNFMAPGGLPTDPPVDILDALNADIPASMFDPKEVAKGVFIRRGGHK